MNLEKAIKTAGSAALASFPPYGTLAVAALNAFLPDGKKLPETATGAQAQTALAQIPEGQRAAVLSQELKLEETKVKEGGDTVRTMLIHDAKNTHSTRPFIAKGCFYVLGAVATLTSSAITYAAVKDEGSTIMALSSSWELIAVVIAPLVYVLKAYFGAIQTEQKQRLNAANGYNIETGLAMITNALKK